MSQPLVVASAWAMALVALGAALIRPHPVRGKARPRQLETQGTQSPLACPKWFAATVARADLPEPVERWWWSFLGAVMGGGLIGIALGGPVVGGLASLLVAGGVSSVLHGARHRRDERLARSVPESLEAIARSSRAGMSIVQSLVALDRPDAGPADKVLARAGAQVGRGGSLRSALGTVTVEHPSVPALRLAVAAILVGADTGAAPSRAVEGVAATLRDRAALDREAGAHAAQAQASAGVLVLAPLGFAVFAVMADPRVGEFLFNTPVGLACLGLGLGLDALGAWWMSRIVRSVR